MRIVNLTQHQATPEQLADGVVDCGVRQRVVDLLTFHVCPDRRVIQTRAQALASLAIESGAEAAMIGGAPYLMAPLEIALRAAGVKPVYAYSARISMDEHLPDGTVRKTQVFRHAGWVWV